ncbi:nucleoside triphosphate pyrophosphohydrolase [Thermosynechococcaceae cyanobacterium BACA0444]|uniref:Nucleoside triphosphate pyrophosphohydrolase n=1 Tax=Pseudocalidococcus azoricus BACA0444 TaxID=2918990 RepID=A0AAE4FPL4_9CYAN|nr:nucleoside triphosphate pyrophosphohydrolase [Pseudocalidococcus azoricus]MDS3859909.1 nucleoside triphosphate pyrophosphohydrolase [Pseudocalidococcus azoricus BACA0444]
MLPGPILTHLQVLPAAAFMAQTADLNLAQPHLITNLLAGETLLELADLLLSLYAPDYPITLIFSEQTSQTLPLKIWLQQADSPAPSQIYLPPQPTPPLSAIQALVNVVAQLRHPETGCPWDLAQTPETLTPYVIEEAYEVVAAIQDQNPQAIAEELGDLLLQVILQAQIAQESAQFTLADVATRITEKLIRRHPHVFADVELRTPEEVHLQWETIKAQEKGYDGEPPLSQKLDRYARTLPPLQAGIKIAEKATAAGFDWPDIAGVWEKFYEELAEFQESLLQGGLAEQESELGDLLFTVICLAQKSELDPIKALQGTHRRFIQRLEKMEAAIDRPLSDYSLAELETFWQQAKKALRDQAQIPSPDIPAPGPEPTSPEVTPELGES